MPTYVYACASCGAQYEKRESFDAKARQKCQECGKTAQRVIQAPPIVFKGSGFYKTDSRGSSRDSASESSASAPAAASSTSSESTTQKPPKSDTTAASSEAAAAS